MLKSILKSNFFKREFQKQLSVRFKFVLKYLTCSSYEFCNDSLTKRVDGMALLRLKVDIPCIHMHPKVKKNERMYSRKLFVCGPLCIYFNEN